jgi:hypothetical protein
MGLGDRKRPLPELIANIGDLVSETNQTVGQINDLIKQLLENGLEVSLIIEDKEIPVKLKFKIPT